MVPEPMRPTTRPRNAYLRTALRAKTPAEKEIRDGNRRVRQDVIWTDKEIAAREKTLKQYESKPPTDPQEILRLQQELAELRDARLQRQQWSEMSHSSQSTQLTRLAVQQRVGLEKARVEGERQAIGLRANKNWGEYMSNLYVHERGSRQATERALEEANIKIISSEQRIRELVRTGQMSEQEATRAKAELTERKLANAQLAERMQAANMREMATDANKAKLERQLGKANKDITKMQRSMITLQQQIAQGGAGANANQELAELRQRIDTQQARIDLLSRGGVFVDPEGRLIRTRDGVVIQNAVGGAGTGGHEGAGVPPKPAILDMDVLRNSGHSETEIKAMVDEQYARGGEVRGGPPPKPKEPTPKPEPVPPKKERTAGEIFRRRMAKNAGPGFGRSLAFMSGAPAMMIWIAIMALSIVIAVKIFGWI